MFKIDIFYSLFTKEKLPEEYYSCGWAHELNKLYQELKDCEGFPYAYCWDAAGEIEKWLGFPRESGLFQVDVPIDGGLLRRHAWNRDPMQRKIDLTLEQMNDYLYLQNRVRSGLIVVRPGTALYKRYIVQ